MMRCGLVVLKLYSLKYDSTFVLDFKVKFIKIKITKQPLVLHKSNDSNVNTYVSNNDSIDISEA